MNALETALQWREKGIATIPIRRRDKRPSVIWRSYNRRLPTESELRFWFSPEPYWTRLRRMKLASEDDPSGEQSVAVVAGWQGLVIVDFDDMDLYQLWRCWCEMQSGIIAELPSLTYQVKTRRGMHVYIAVQEPAQNLKLHSVDVQAQAKYVLTPPSVHPSGHVYKALEPDAPIVRVRSLAQVLPEELLIVEEPEPAPRSPLERVEEASRLSSDPFAAAMRPAALAFDGPVDEIHRRYDIQSLVDGVVRRGRNLYAKCPLHNDNDPSMQIDGNRVKCWAGCTRGKWWDVIDLYAALNGLSNREAIQELASC